MKAKKIIVFVGIMILSIGILISVLGGNNLDKPPYHKINLKQYEEFIDSKTSFIMYIHKTNCPACQQMKPVVKKVIETGKTNMYAINLDEKDNYNVSFLKANRIDKTPTLIVYEKGKEKNRLEGIQPLGNIYKLLNLKGAN
ncbi:MULTISPECIES: thioredoxin family protein [Paenibacillus]|uniref:thioredoxin family protein n=1 Tax=Paenibacillus TaxID=44249 RepID=UPI0013E92C76|nr:MULTISPECIES: thioredoxin family protein [Paenibacillus]KAF6587055.1 thioredoxin family protein [Paenibacillus sp. EKM211P]MCJ1219907.1 thioredoxin family protein [Paenibacillus polymyxa]MDU8673598.1 thioredoxin family protein [Paenibacillus polymyxa]MDU8698504.1 thioredoxin family protein [Paenibacillus polymyxa]URJ57633.3 thioredoxin family protein [Paenibacillus polymyxa]